MYSCQHCEYKSTRRYNLNVHVNNKHGVHDYQRDSTSPESMQRNQIGGSALTTPQQEQVLQPEQQRVPIEYYQNIKNQLDHPSSSYIQWQDSYKKELRRMKIFETQAELSKETIAKLLNML